MSFNNMYRFSAHAVIVNDAGKVLQLKQTYGDQRWGLPGGAIETGETIHEAIVRECKEELGLDVTVHCLTGLYYHSSFHSQVAIYKCSLPENEEIKLSEEHSEYGWFSLEDLGEVQRLRVQDAINYNGPLISARSF